MSVYGDFYPPTIKASACRLMSYSIIEEGVAYKTNRSSGVNANDFKGLAIDWLRISRVDTLKRDG